MLAEVAEGVAEGVRREWPRDSGGSVRGCCLTGIAFHPHSGALCYPVANPVRAERSITKCLCALAPLNTIRLRDMERLVHPWIFTFHFTFGGNPNDWVGMNDC